MAEFSLLVSIYGQFPDLATKSLTSDSVEGGVGVGRSVLSTVLVFCHGWGHYLRHKVRTAGLGLALLYMTVLGFDTITWSYALLQVSQH